MTFEEEIFRDLLLFASWMTYHICMEASALLYIREGCTSLVTRVVEVPFKQGMSGQGLHGIACSLNLVQRADRIEQYRNGKFVKVLKDRSGSHEDSSIAGAASDHPATDDG